MSNEVQDTGMVLKIAHLYPTLMSVAADRGNLYAIQKRCLSGKPPISPNMTCC